MTMIDLIPSPYRLLAGAVFALTVIVGSALAGAMVNGWRLERVHLKELAVKQQEYDALLDKVREQNQAIATLSAVAQNADSLRKEAEKHAAVVIKGIDKRAAAVAGSSATNCDGVLREAWGAWQ
jgi:hypothetical protein